MLFLETDRSCGQETSIGESSFFFDSNEKDWEITDGLSVSRLILSTSVELVPDWISLVSEIGAVLMKLKRSSASLWTLAVLLLPGIIGFFTQDSVGDKSLVSL